MDELAVWIFNASLFIATFFFMEFVAWFTHKYIMHGFLWILHRDHHKRDDGQVFERNDAFFIIFALPAILLIISSTMNGVFDYRFWIGAGITAYGFAYFIVHDVFIHQRFSWFRKTNNSYFRAIRRAHAVHHARFEKEGGECFGMLWVPVRFLKEYKKA